MRQASADARWKATELPREGGQAGVPHASTRPRPPALEHPHPRTPTTHTLNRERGGQHDPRRHRRPPPPRDARVTSPRPTLSPTAGAALWLDGAQVASNGSSRTPESTTGYWKIGYDTLGGQWPNVGSSYFGGSLRYAAVKSTVLTPTQIQNHYAAGR